VESGTVHDPSTHVVRCRGPVLPGTRGGRTHPTGLGTGAADDRHHGLIGASDAATFMLDEDRLRQRLARWAKREDADALISAFRADRPEASPSDLFFAIPTADSFPQGCVDPSRLEGTPECRSGLSLRTRLADSRLTVARRTARTRSTSAGVRQRREICLHGRQRPEARAACRRSECSSAWLAFARPAIRRQKSLPWPPWRPNNRATMVFDTESRVVNGFRTRSAGMQTKGPFD